jgi:hypothetical protein
VVDLREPELLRKLELLALVGELRADHVVREEAQVGRAALAAVLLLDRARGQVARVRELALELRELAELHVQLAADLELDALGRQLARDRLDVEGVGGDVLALAARAAGRRQHQLAAPVVAQAAGHAVHLRHHEDLAL